MNNEFLPFTRVIITRLSEYLNKNKRLLGLMLVWSFSFLLWHFYTVSQIQTQYLSVVDDIAKIKEDAQRSNADITTKLELVLLEIKILERRSHEEPQPTIPIKKKKR